LQSIPNPKSVICKTKEAIYRIFKLERNFCAAVGYLEINISADINSISIISVQYSNFYKEIMNHCAESFAISISLVKEEY
jgi:hypothetical protein